MEQSEGLLSNNVPGWHNRYKSEQMAISCHSHFRNAKYSEEWTKQRQKLFVFNSTLQIWSTQSQGGQWPHLSNAKNNRSIQSIFQIEATPNTLIRSHSRKYYIIQCHLIAISALSYFLWEWCNYTEPMHFRTKSNLRIRSRRICSIIPKVDFAPIDWPGLHSKQEEWTPAASQTALIK